MDKRGEAPLLIHQGRDEEDRDHQSLDGGTEEKISNQTAEVWMRGVRHGGGTVGVSFTVWCSGFHLVNSV